MTLLHSLHIEADRGDGATSQKEGQTIDLEGITQSTVRIISLLYGELSSLVDDC